MKLNPDCVRDILLWTEEHQTMTSHSVSELEVDEYLVSDVSRTHDKDSIIYTLRQLSKNGMLDVAIHEYGDDADIVVKDITPTGHEFLANIHSDTVWSGVKETAAKVGSKSLSALTQIASSVVTTIIKAQFGLP